jgi:hypothetical protein
MSEESNICLRGIFAYNFQTLLKKIIGTEDVSIRYDNEKEAVFNNMFCKFIKKSYTSDGLINNPKYNQFVLFNIYIRNHTGNYIIRPFKMTHMIQLLLIHFNIRKMNAGIELFRDLNYQQMTNV